MAAGPGFLLLLVALSCVPERPARIMLVELEPEEGEAKEDGETAAGGQRPAGNESKETGYRMSKRKKKGRSGSGGYWPQACDDEYDEAENCYYWRRKGQCFKKAPLYDYMKKYCAATCCRLYYDYDACFDDKDYDCGRFARKGYCRQGSYYFKYVSKNCGESCCQKTKFCGRDSSSYCRAWAKRGYCSYPSSFYRYVMRKCARSCCTL